MATAIHFRSRLLAGAAVGVLAVGLMASAKHTVVDGECAVVNGADICTWGEMSGNTLVAFGATIPVAYVKNAPDEAPMVWPPVADAVLGLPDAVKAATGFQSLTVYWEPHGHPPGPYLTPHFDFHFNAISHAELNAIDCSDSSKPRQLPSGFELPDVQIPGIGMLTGICVPQMGMHSVLASELHSDELFKKTKIVGYYHGTPIFVEPMITRETLMAEHDFSLDIPAVSNTPAGTAYPTRFSAEYDAGAHAYRFVFSDFAVAGGH